VVTLAMPQPIRTLVLLALILGLPLETLERIYIGRRFKNDTERLETLFQLYTEMTGRKK
jgi:hypothetical protein